MGGSPISCSRKKERLEKSTIAAHKTHRYYRGFVLTVDTHPIFLDLFRVGGPFRCHGCFAVAYQADSLAAEKLCRKGLMLFVTSSLSCFVSIGGRLRGGSEASRPQKDTRSYCWATEMRTDTVGEFANPACSTEYRSYQVPTVTNSLHTRTVHKI